MKDPTRSTAPSAGSKTTSAAYDCAEFDLRASLWQRKAPHEVRCGRLGSWRMAGQHHPHCYDRLTLEHYRWVYVERPWRHTSAELERVIQHTARRWRPRS